MGQILTPTMTIAAIGLLKGQGLGINSTLTNSLTSFGTTGISGAVSSLLTSSINPAISIALQSLPPFLSGLTATAPTGFSSTRLAYEIQSQANRMMSRGVGGFISVLGAAGSYAETNFNLQGAIAQARGSSFSNFGLSMPNFAAMRSGGIANQFSAGALQALSKGINNFGSMFNVKDFSKMSNPGFICQNLINQGLGSYGNLSNKLIDAGMDLSSLENEPPAEIQRIMASIKGSDLDAMITTTKFIPAPGVTLTSLADVTNINNLMGSASRAALGGDVSLDSLANKLDNIGGDFSSPNGLSKMISSINVSSYPDLDQLTALLPDSIYDGIDDLLGSGSGPFGNPTVDDVLGAVTGDSYIDNLSFLTDLQTDVVESTEVQALGIAILSGDPIAIAAASELINSSSSTELQNAIAAGNEKFQGCFDQLANEKRNISLAGINIATAPVSLQNTAGLAFQLHSFAEDPMGLGVGSHIGKMVSSDIYGQAISASLEEGKNLANLAKSSVKTYTKLDPIAFASTLA